MVFGSVAIIQKFITRGAAYECIADIASGKSLPELTAGAIAAAHPTKRRETGHVFTIRSL